MIEKVHEHIIGELRQNARTDTVFVLTAILLNLVMLATNATLAATSKESAIATVIMAILIALVLVINVISITGLVKGKIARHRPLDGLIRMYKDKGVDNYYDASLLGAYDTRYTLFIIAIISLGSISVLIPILTRIF
jgi:pheromone shutdown protein TraB